MEGITCCYWGVVVCAFIDVVDGTAVLPVLPCLLRERERQPDSIRGVLRGNGEIAGLSEVTVLAGVVAFPLFRRYTVLSLV